MRITLLLALLTTAISVNAADYLHPTGSTHTTTAITGGPHNYYDDGDTGGDYKKNMNAAMQTFQAPVGQYVKLTFTYFYTEGTPWDFLQVWDGPDNLEANSKFMVGLGGNYGAISYTFVSSGRELTIEAYSDGTVQYDGWTATVECVTDPYMDWTGTTDTDWSTSTNWEYNAVPGFWTHCRIPSAPGNQPTVSNNEDAECSDLNIASGATLTMADNTDDFDVMGDLTISGDIVQTGTQAFSLYCANAQEHTISGQLTTLNDGNFDLDVGPWKLASDVNLSDLYIVGGEQLDLDSYTLLSQELEIAGTILGSTGTIRYEGTPANLSYTGTFTQGTSTFYYSAGESWSAIAQTVEDIDYYNLKVRANNGFTATIGTGSTIDVDKDLTFVNPGTAGGVISTASDVTVDGSWNVGTTGNALMVVAGHRIYRPSGTGTFTMGNNSSSTINVTYASSSNDWMSGFGTPTFYGTTNYNSASAQRIIGANYEDLTTSSTGAKSLTGTVDISDDLTISAGEFKHQATSSSTLTNGTGTLSESLGSCFRGLYEDSRVQYIYPASELSANGMSANDVITSIAFNVSSKNSTGSYANFTVKLGHSATTKYASAAWLTPSFTTCYSGTYTSAIDWNTIAFSSNFTWDGTNSIVVEICYDNTAWTSNDYLRATNFGNSDRRCVYAEQDGASGCSIAAESRQRDRPNARFSVEVAGSTYNITCAGDVSNSGTYTAGTGKMTLDGSATQNITGTTAISFYDLNISSTGGVTVLKGPTVTNEIEFQSGYVTAATVSEPLTLGASCSIDATYVADDASHVIGYVAKNTTATTKFEFPTGNGTDYRKISVTPAGTGATTYTARYNGSGSGDYSVKGGDPDINHVSEIEYWDLNRAGASPENAVIELSWDNSSGVDANYSDLLVCHYDGADWETCGSSGIVGSASAGVISTNGNWSTYSPFALGSRTINNPLPVELVHFGAAKSGEDVKLTWTTSSEVDNDFFTIEKSKDGESFMPIAEISGAGYSSVMTEYEDYDYAPFSGENYYRLKQTDFNGDFAYSNIEFVKMDASFFDVDVHMNVFPNPAKSESGIHVELEGLEKSKEILIVMSDVLGRTVYSKAQVASVDGVVIMNIIPQENLPKGVYTILGSSDHTFYSKKVMIE